MNTKIEELCNSTIDLYRQMKEELRYDGEYINHLGALLFSRSGEVNISNIKEIRKYFKANTSRMSSFRGDILYMLSMLIHLDNGDYKKRAQNVIDVYEELVENDFKESAYLVLSAYSIIKYKKNIPVQDIIERTKEIYYALKEKYDNVINDEDYLICVLLAIEEFDGNEIVNRMDSLYESVSELDLFPNNGVQELITTLFLNESSSSAQYNLEKLLIELEKKDLKLSSQFLPLVGICQGYENPKAYVDTIIDIINCLIEEEPSYEFFMDKSFRSMIALSILLYSDEDEDIKYMNEILTYVVYQFLESKNQGLMAEVLA